MAQTITTVISAVAMTTATNLGNATVLTLQAGTSMFSVEARLTSTTQIERSKLNLVKFASSSYSATAAAGCAAHIRCSTALEVIPTVAAGLSISTSDGALNKGGYVYLWTEHAAMPTGTTLTVIVTEF